MPPLQPFPLNSDPSRSACELYPVGRTLQQLLRVCGRGRAPTLAAGLAFRRAVTGPGVGAVRRTN